jgi:hypothetical protein
MAQFVPSVIGREDQPTYGDPADPLPFWHVRFTERVSGKTCVGYLGEAVPTPSGGGGGWENVAMPKRGSVSVWRGKGDLRLALEVIFSKFIEGENVLHDVVTLWRMYSPPYAEESPPSITINAKGTLAPFEAVPWLIEEFEWGDAEANVHGNRSLQRISLTLLEYRRDPRIVRTSRHQWPAMVIVKKGWTLKTIAEKYKVPGGWRAIGKIQRPPITDPRKVKVNQHIRMP